MNWCLVDGSCFSTTTIWISVNDETFYTKYLRIANLGDITIDWFISAIWYLPPWTIFVLNQMADINLHL